jgi:IS30 family transposase
VAFSGEGRPGRAVFGPEVKAEFQKLMAELGSVTLVCARMRLNRNTCYRWARELGFAKRRSEMPSREHFLRLRDEGLSCREAGTRLGIHPTTAKEWDAGVRRRKNGRIYPDGRVIDYDSGMETVTVQGARPSLAALEQPIDPRYLSLAEREGIRDLHASGASLRAIGTALGRSASTVSRELKRNKTPDGQYLPYAAQRAAVARRARIREPKLSVPGPLREYVQDRLSQRWSPEQICHALIKDFPEDPEMRVSPETIYQALYVQARGGLRREVAAALRTGRARRRPRNTGQERRPRFSDPMVMISERPPEAEDRAVPGHWEGDLITGAYNQSAIGTLVERSTRYVMLLHLPEGHTAGQVRDALVDAVAGLPAHLRGSLTWDQGSEMAAHKSFTVATGVPVYFCDPASPWQRGSNENTNGLLRQYFPKGTDLSAYGPEDLEHVAQQLNARPRKTLGWNTPAERLRDLLVPN